MLLQRKECAADRRFGRCVISVSEMEDLGEQLDREIGEVVALDETTGRIMATLAVSRYRGRGHPIEFERHSLC